METRPRQRNRGNLDRQATTKLAKLLITLEGLLAEIKDIRVRIVALEEKSGGELLAYSVDAFAKATAHSGKSRVYELIGAGMVKARKLGTRTIITREDAKEFVRSLPLIDPAGIKTGKAAGNVDAARVSSRVWADAGGLESK